MWKRLAMAGAVALLAAAAPAAAQDILPTEENPYDPSGCNEYHQMRDRLDATGAVPSEFQTEDADEPADLVTVDPLFDMLSLMFVWNSEVFPCK